MGERQYEAARRAVKRSAERRGLCSVIDMLAGLAEERATAGRDTVAWREALTALEELSDRLAEHDPGLFAPHLAPEDVAPATYRFGRALRRVLRTDRVFGILPDGSWTQGGCWVLASALVEWIGPGARLYMTSCDRHRAGDHVVCRVAGVYLDGDGVQSERSLLAKLERYEGCLRPRVVDFDEDAMRRSGAFAPADYSAALLEELRLAFGEYDGVDPDVVKVRPGRAG